MCHHGEAQHQKTGRCATIGIPTLERLRLQSVGSYSIVWWMQAAQASEGDEAQHRRQRRCATIGKLYPRAAYRLNAYLVATATSKDFHHPHWKGIWLFSNFDGERVVDTHYHLNFIV